MGKISSNLKDRYHAKASDEIKVRVGKGQKDIIKSHADRLYGGSVNKFINMAIMSQLERDRLVDNEATKE